jgi:toxin ParE1/3/4
MRRLRIAARAVEERRNALRASRLMFGRSAAQAYGALIRRAYMLLSEDPQRAGVRRPDDLEEGVYLFHLRHARTRATPPKQPRHIVVFSYDDTTLTVLRLLHDSMDVDQHIAGDEES